MLKSSDIKQLAYDSGFDLCGITAAENIPEAKERLESWIAQGFHGEMHWIARNTERRTDLQQLLADVRSVVMLGLNYYQPNNETPPDHGRVSRYARGRDYHSVIEEKSKRMIDSITAQVSADEKFLTYVDYGPFLERPYAVKAGLGYIGKNSMLINRQFGSWIFLAEILTTLDLEPDDQYAVNHGRCGECRRCIEACPTQAIVEDGVINANRCISYLTIERPSSISETLAAAMGDLMFGCDICQEVCPHNGRAITTQHTEFMPQSGAGEFLDTKMILSMQSEEDFKAKFAGTPLTRPKLVNMQRTARIVQNNQTK